MPVVNIVRMAVGVRHALMTMPMTMGDLNQLPGFVLVRMILVVLVHMRVLDSFMSVQMSVIVGCE